MTRRRATLVGLFLISLAIFLFEILMSRLTSVALFYHLAFYVIANALLGGAAGGLVVYLWPDVFPRERAGRRMYQFSASMAISVPVCTVLAFLTAGLGTFFEPLAVYTMIQLWGILLFVPFALGGVVVTLGITRSGLSTGLAYGANMIGAAAGCLAAILLLRYLDGTSAVLLSASLMGTAALVFLSGSERETRSAAIGVGLLVVLLAAAGFLNARGSPPTLRPWYKMGEWDGPYSYVGWNSSSRVTVSRTERRPPGDFAPYGENTPDTVLDPLPQRTIQIDGTALTPMVKHGHRLRKHDYLDWSLRVFAYRFRPGGPVAILGVGGGMEAIAAARHGHENIVGIDINDVILGLHTDVMPGFSGLSRIPGLELVHRDARRYLTETERTFRIISMSFVDTWASVGAGAGSFALSENGLYTVEAWETYFDRLRPDGILSATRWFNPEGAGETTRLLALARQALWESGVQRPRDHLALLQAGTAATLLAAKNPFSAEDRRRLRRAADRLGFRLLVAPGVRPDKPDLQLVMDARSPGELRAAARRHPLDLLPSTDDRPYFFNMLTFSSMFGGTFLPDSPRHSLNINLIALYSLLFALGASLLLTVFVLVVPTLLRGRALDPLSWEETLVIFGYFGIIGLAFMFVEIALLARQTIYLGHPVLSLAVVLGGMIFAAGAGSIASERFRVNSRVFLVGYPMIIGGLLLLLAAYLDSVLGVTRTFGTGARIGISALMAAAVAFPMGFALPVGLRFVRRYCRVRNLDLDLTPWLWCVNGVTSVLGSGLGLALSLHVGVSATVTIGGGLYLTLMMLLPLLGGRSSA